MLPVVIEGAGVSLGGLNRGSAVKEGGTLPDPDKKEGFDGLMGSPLGRPAGAAASAGECINSILCFLTRKQISGLSLLAQGAGFAWSVYKIAMGEYATAIPLCVATALGAAATQQIYGLDVVRKEQMATKAQLDEAKKTNEVLKKSKHRLQKKNKALVGRVKDLEATAARFVEEFRGARASYTQPN